MIDSIRSCYRLLAGVPLIVVAACGDSAVTDPPDPSLAKGGGKPIKVTEVIPPTAEQGQTILGMIIRGSGFEEGAVVRFHPSGQGDGEPDPSITVGPSNFISDRRLEVDVTIDLATEIGAKDVSVQLRGGRRGVGSDKLEVTSKGDPTATVVINTGVTGAGVYGDGGGPYSGIFSSEGNLDLWVSADCPREMRLDLRGQGLGAPFGSVIASCSGNGGSSASPRITVPLLLGASAGALLGDPVPSGSSGLLGDAAHYYFLDGKTPYNVIWQSGIRVTSVIDNCAAPNPNQVYTVSTDPDLAVDADLHTREGKGKPKSVKIDDVIAHLDMTVTVTPCP